MLVRGTDFFAIAVRPPGGKAQNAPSWVKVYPGKRGAAGVLGHFHPHRGHIGRRQTCRPQHRILGEHFAVHLRDKIVLTISIVPPHLPELDGLHRHVKLLNSLKISFRVPGRMQCVN